LKNEFDIASLKVVDIFSGCGGLSMGFIQSGFNVVASFDNWDIALKHCRLNFDHPALCCDMGDVPNAIKEVEAFSPDIIIGGPPCQDFSSAGKRDESCGRADMTIAYANIVAAVSPQYFVMENVARALKSKAFAAAKEILQNAGYGLTSCVLDASLCGAPQARKRLFLLGAKGAEEGAIYPFLMERLASKPMTVREYFGDAIDIDYYYRHPRSYKRRGIFSVDEPSPTIRGVNRPVPNGYPGHPGDPVSISPRIRPLTTQERAMIQTFPEDYVFDGTKSEEEQLIGNAVPINLGKYVAESLKHFMTRAEKSEKPVFVLFEKKSMYRSSNDSSLKRSAND